MVDPHHVAHWYPTAAYLYVLWLDASRWPGSTCAGIPITGSTGCAVIADRTASGASLGLAPAGRPGLDARDAHPAWLPGHDAVVQLYPDADPPLDAGAFAFWRIPGHKQLLHDGKRLALIARSPGHCLRFALAPGLEDGMAVAYAHRGGAAAPARGHALGRDGGHACGGGSPRPRPPRCWNCTPCRRSTRPWRARPCARWAKGCSARMPWPIGTATAACAPRCAAWCGAAMR
jgi:hypothetical protein